MIDTFMSQGPSCLQQSDSDLLYFGHQFINKAISTVSKKGEAIQLVAPT